MVGTMYLHSSFCATKLIGASLKSFWRQTWLIGSCQSEGSHVKTKRKDGGTMFFLLSSRYLSICRNLLRCKNSCRVYISYLLHRCLFRHHCSQATFTEGNNLHSTERHDGWYLITTFLEWHTFQYQFIPFRSGDCGITYYFILEEC